jgi:hypothetical protein
MAPPDFVPALAAEFPNDNPSLHRGATWTLLELGGRVRAVVRAEAARPIRDVPAASQPILDAEWAQAHPSSADPCAATVEAASETP